MTDEKTNNPQITLYGWTCPRCGIVYSPFTPECTRCGPVCVTTSHPTKGRGVDVDIFTKIGGVTRDDVIPRQTTNTGDAPPAPGGTTSGDSMRRPAESYFADNEEENGQNSGD